MRNAVVSIAIVAALLAASPSLAAEERTGGWSAGVRGGYLFVPDGLLDAWYDKHTSIASGFIGVYGAYAFPTFEVDFGANYYALNFENGNWLKEGDGPDETDYVDANLGLVDIDVSVLGKWKLHPYVGYRLGAGIGFGFLYGDYASYDVIGGVRQEEKSTPSKPSVVPILIVQTGFSFYFIPDRFAFNLDFGFRDGIFGGGGLQGWF
jgi:hypothetical protein